VRKAVPAEPGRSLPPFIHESAYVDAGAVVGDGTKIWHFSHVMPGAVIGPRCNLGQNVVVMSGTKIGANVKIQNNVSVYEGVELEDDVFCGPSMVFTNVMNPRSHIVRKHEYRRTLVRRGASIGANATIVCGVTVGQYAFIGAGAVVTGDVRDFALVVGVPAKQLGWMCHCGERLADPGAGSLSCAACASVYRRSGEDLVMEVMRTPGARG
jgi:UDP-2-acetamido-3-amino-2,3-dideoxy-glucuronate N-acetyltransferase